MQTRDRGEQPDHHVDEEEECAIVLALDLIWPQLSVGKHLHPPSMSENNSRTTALREKAGVSALVLSSHQRLLHCFS